jgi:ribosomal protein L40E
MTAQPFTRNHTDHSNDTGYQFEFHCDKCGNGYRSTWQASTLGMAAGMLRAASSLFSGLSSVGSGASQVKDLLRGPAYDAAFKEAIEEIRPKFHQCSRCGKWVCPEVCWNAERGLCEDCAPNLQEAAASAQAQAAVEQVNERARKSDQTDGLDMASKQSAAGTTCSKCQAALPPNAKFCVGCGTKVAAAAKAFCAECGAERAAGAKFCAECGKPA